MEKRFADRGVTVAGRKLTGHAALFNVPARVLVNGRTVTERVAPGAFKRTLAAKPDVLALRDHDAAKLLGRTRSGTLRLAEDATGLAFEIDVPDTQDGRDALALAERGDLGGGSFGFVVRGETWNADKSERTVTDVDLVEVSVISAHPAYATSVQARAADDAAPTAARMRRLRLGAVQ